MLTIKGFSLETMPNQLSLQCSSGMEWEYIGITGGVPPPNMQPGARFRAFGHSQKEAELENEHEYHRRGLGAKLGRSGSCESSHVAARATTSASGLCMWFCLVMVIPLKAR